MGFLSPTGSALTLCPHSGESDRLLKVNETPRWSTCQNSGGNVDVYVLNTHQCLLKPWRGAGHQGHKGGAAWGGGKADASTASACKDVLFELSLGGTWKPAVKQPREGHRGERGRMSRGMARSCVREVPEKSRELAQDREGLPMSLQGVWVYSAVSAIAPATARH